MTATLTEPSVETILDRIGVLVAERQALRLAAAPREQLERNRVEIAEAQQRLSYALIARYLPAVKAA